MEQNEGSESNESTEQTENIVPNAEQNMISDQIEISAIEVDEVYGWSISNETNPTITIAANVDNVIQITNLTDVQHELVIESDGKEIAASGDIGPYLSGKLSVNPSMTGTFGYHCQYHPDTMKGTIIVKP